MEDRCYLPFYKVKGAIYALKFRNLNKFMYLCTLYAHKGLRFGRLGRLKDKAVIGFKGRGA